MNLPRLVTTFKGSICVGMNVGFVVGRFYAVKTGFVGDGLLLPGPPATLRTRRFEILCRCRRISKVRAYIGSRT